MESVIPIIANLGVPTVVLFFVLFKVNGKLDMLLDALRELTEEVAALREVIRDYADR